MKMVEAKKSRKQRFVEFLDETFENASHAIEKKINNQRYPLILKVIVKDIKYLRFIEIEEKKCCLIKKLKNKKKIDCYMIFNKAKTAHHILSGKLLPINSSLIGKFKIGYLTKNGLLFSAIYQPAKSSYLKMVKGTRFTSNKNGKI